MATKDAAKQSDVVLRILVDPFSDNPFMLVVRSDYIVTGDVAMSAVTLEEMERINSVVQWASNYVADVHWELMEIRRLDPQMRNGNPRRS